MEAIKPVSISLAHDPIHFGIEAEVGRRLIPSVNLKLLSDPIDARPKCLKQRRVRGLGRQHSAWQQHHAIASRHGRDATPGWIKVKNPAVPASSA